ncbi:MHYT domain-containing protein [Dactylosporangium fulvum]|uniref:Histidine kinase n=1 Tax=Dactylosporangium fulvum TaxID=53359 RepID=A0ABY5VT77_9ACTN|nr:MHYT domain-containing protein [Dactylosporangium fulvum]UWP80755.1 histidine kinase [Dactylosporangium fulvum]
MTAVEHFAYGWITPVLALVMAFLGCLPGICLAIRSRASSGGSRARWLTLSAVAVGGSGTWVPHFMALLGADVPGTVVRYDRTVVLLGLGIAVVAHCLGLYIVGFGHPSGWKIVPAGVLTGLGLTAVHCTGPLAMRIAGIIRYDPGTLLAGAVASIVAATVTLWCVSVIRGNAAMLCAAAIMAVGVCGTHYTVMAAVRAEVAPVAGEVPGVNLFTLLTPVCVLACLLFSALAYSTVGFSVRQDTAGEEALLRQARDMYSVATLARAAVNRKVERDRGAATVPFRN